MSFNSSPKTLERVVVPQIKQAKNNPLVLTFCRNFSSTNIEGELVASDNENIFVPLGNGKLSSFNPQNGSTNWITEFGGKIITRPLISDDFLYIVTKTENKDSKSYLIRQIDKISGVTIWQRTTNNQISGKDIQESVNLQIWKNYLLLSISNGIINLIDPRDGSITKTINLEISLSTIPFLADNKFLLGTIDDQLITVSTENLKITNKSKIAFAPTIIFQIANTLILGNERGEIAALKTPASYNSIIWKFRVGGEILNIGEAASNVNVLVTSADNYIYSFSTNNGKLHWKKRLNSRPTFLPLIIDEYGIFATIGESEAPIIELRTGKTVNKIKLASGSFFTGNPQNTQSSVIFPDSQGLSVFSKSRSCMEYPLEKESKN